MGTLGCPTRYDVAIHWQGGKRLFARLDGVTEVTWSRKLGDYSESTVKLATGRVSTQCWHAIMPIYDDDTMIKPGMTPWAHEISIYRDRHLVWQGPIVESTKTRDELEINARDVIAWMDRRVIDLNLSGGHPDGDKFRGETGTVLRHIVERTWPGSHESHPYDNPGITEYSRIDDTPGKFSETERVWKGSRTVGDLVRDLISNGIDMFTLGRKLYMIPDYYRVEHSPHRLTDDHILGDIEVRQLGLDMATEGFVVTQAEGSGANEPPLFGRWPQSPGPGSGDNPATPPFFGRITRFHEATSLSGESGQGASQPALDEVARSIRAYGFPCPVAVIIGDDAALAPHAPVTIGQLVPGRPFQVELRNYLHKTSELFRLNEIEVTWKPEENNNSSSGQSDQTSSESAGPEQVKVSLVTLRNPPIPSEDNSSGSAA